LRCGCACGPTYARVGVGKPQDVPSVTSTGHGKGSYEVGSNAADWAPVDHLRESKGAGMPTYLQQGDLLQALGSFLVARGDTFVIRAYGDVVDPLLANPASVQPKDIQGRAWCEAVVQRLPEYVDASNAASVNPNGITGTGAVITALNQKFGRKFRIVAFRWLSPNDI
jgi:hypothetical protein